LIVPVVVQPIRLGAADQVTACGIVRSILNATYKAGFSSIRVFHSSATARA
jgi:hypothetical protein